MTPGAFTAATQPMQVPDEVAANPWSDPNAIQNMMLANQGLKDFDGFVARNNVARLVPGKRVRSFLRVPNGVVRSQGALAPGMTLDRTLNEAAHPSDIYIPVMDGEDDKAAYERYQNDLQKWNGSMLPFRWADYFVNRTLPESLRAGFGMYTGGSAGAVGLPLALDNLRAYVARNSPVHGLERMDTERDWVSPDWSWAVFGGAMEGGAQLARVGMLRFVETGAGQAFMRGVQKAGIGALGEAGLPLAGEGLLGAPLGRSSALFEWLGNKVGTKAFSGVRPDTFKRAEDALRKANAQLRITPEGLDVGLAAGTPPNMAELQGALRALKAEMSTAGEKAAFRIFTDVPGTFGAAAGGAAAGGAVAADPLARTDLTDEQRKLIAVGVPKAMLVGGAVPLGLRATGAALELLGRNKEAPSFRVVPPGEAKGPARFLLDMPRRDVPTPPSTPPPRTFGEGPTPGGLPPDRVGPAGPVTPDSGIYSMPLSQIPSVETNGALSTPAAEQFGIQTSVRAIQRTLPYVQDPKQLLQARQLLDGLASEQTQIVAGMNAMGADPAMLEGRNKAISARLDAVNRMLGKDLAPTTMAIGIPAEGMLFDPAIPPPAAPLEPVRMGLLTWAHGLASEASRLGVDLPALTAELPPPANPWDIPTMTMRLQALSTKVHAMNPDAAVGPPTSMTPDLPDEIRKIQPVRVEPIPSTDLPDPQTLAREHFPTAAELRSDPVAVRRQTYAASRLASGMKFHVGDLVPSVPAALRDTDPIRVPIFQDASGRLMARLSADDGGEAKIEVTDSLTRLALPQDAGWEFAANPLAPIPYRLDPEQELLQVDQERFDGKGWIREVYKDATWGAIQGEMIGSPTANPVSMANAVQTTPPQSVEDANGLLDRINRMQAEHEGLHPSFELAQNLAGPGAEDDVVRRLHGEMLQEYAGMGSLIEHARATTLAHKTRLEQEAYAARHVDPLGFGSPSPFGIAAGKNTERHLRGPGIYARLSQAVNTLEPAQQWTPESITNRLMQEGVSLQDMDLAGVVGKFEEVAEANGGVLSSKQAGKVIDDRGEQSLAETIAELVGPNGPLSFVSAMARGSEGDAKAQTRFDPKLIGALGASQYQGQLGPIVVKELLQNAKDSVMAAIERGWTDSAKPSINLIIGEDNSIHIEDNGVGMNPNVAAKEYVEIGGSFKPGESASGGFGLAKIAYLPNANSILVVTVSDTPYGRVKTSLQGTGEDWADPSKGLSMRVTPAEAADTTGTRIHLEMGKLADLSDYNVRDFLSHFALISDLPFEFNYVLNGVSGLNVARKREEILVHSTPTADFRICDFVSGKTQEGYTNIHFGNNGIYQFSTTYHANGLMFPDELWVDVKSKVGVDEPGYPFTTNREALKNDLLYGLQNRIRNDVCGKLGEKQRNFYRDVITGAPGFQHASGFHAVDTMRNLPEDLVKNLTESPELGRMVLLLNRHYQSLIGRLNELEDRPGQGSYIKTNGRFLGIGLSGKYHGVNVLGYAVGKAGDPNLIMLNPFVSWLTVQKWADSRGTEAMDDHLQAEMLAGAIEATLLHEITHQEVRSDTLAAFGGALTKNIGNTAHLTSKFVTKLTELLEANNGQLLDTIAGFAGQLESHWASGKDAFDSISAHSSRPPSNRDDSSGPPDRGGRRSGQRGSVRGSDKDEASELESGAAVPGSGAFKEETEARLRAEALARAASNTGWSGKRGPQLFAALTDAERTDALISRVANGKFVNRKHLMAMSPQKWMATDKYPRYFKDWRPTPGQMTAVSEAFIKRLEAFNRSEATLSKIVTAAKPRVPGGMRPPLLKLSDITSIDPTHLEILSKDPNTFDEWVRQYYRSVDAIDGDPEAVSNAEVRKHLDMMKDAVRTMADNRVLGGVHPYDDPPTAFGALTKIQAWAHNQQAIMQGRVRQLGRPSYVIGWRKQITHPAEWNENKEELSRNVYHILYSGYLKHAQALEGYINQTALLHQAASGWMARPAAKLAEGPATLNINEPPPKDMSPEVVLDRAIATFLDQRPSAAEIEKSAYRFHNVKVGAFGKAKIDLSAEMPKLYKLYDELITGAEQAMILKNRTESVRYKARGEALEGELRARILRAAQEETPQADYQSFEHIDSDTVNAIIKGLRATDEGNKNADPMSIGARKFKSVEAAWRAALRQYEKRKDLISGIQNGDLRREGYYTAVHKMTVDEVRNMLRDPQSIWSRYTTSDVRNYFLNERKSDKEPYRSWSVGWTFYLPAMLRTIHLEPALINVVPKIQQLPSDLRQYADQVVRQMKGDLDQTDRLMNQLAVSSWAETPTLASEMGRWSGTDHIERLRNDPEARLQLVGSKAWTKFVEGIAGATYLALMSPLKVAKMTVTELAFWGREMMKRPQDSIPLLAMGSAGIGRAGFEGLRELASWLHSFGYGGPRWYGEATMMKVTDSLNELALERHTLPTHLDVPAKLYKAAIQTWYGCMRSTEYTLRASTYYGLKWNAKRFGLEEDDARELAARMTNDLIGAFGPLETSPSPRGTTGRAVFQFKRFLAAKTDLLTGDFFNTTRLFMPQRDLNLSLGEGGGNPPPDTPLGLASATATPPGGGPPPPPPLTASSFGDWTPDERNSWEKYAEPVGHMGATFQSSRIAQWRSFLAFLGLIAAAYPTVGFISQMGRAFWNDDDPNAPGQSILDMMFPWDFRRINTIPMLWPIEYIERIALLEAKKYAPFTGGLTPKEDRELKVRKQAMVEAAWPVGAVLKQHRYDEQLQKYEDDKAKREQRKLNQRPHGPSRPHAPRP
jgi:hypothetical protein